MEESWCLWNRKEHYPCWWIIRRDFLSRVAGLFSRRGYNIETITAGVTADPRYTRMTVVLYCSDEMILEQIKKQLAKLVDVRDIKELKPDESVRRS